MNASKAAKRISGLAATTAAAVGAAHLGAACHGIWVAAAQLHTEAVLAGVPLQQRPLAGLALRWQQKRRQHAMTTRTDAAAGHKAAAGCARQGKALYIKCPCIYCMILWYTLLERS